MRQEGRQGDITNRSELRDTLEPPGRDRVSDAGEHDVSSDGIELEVAARGQEREVLLDLLLEVVSAAAKQGSVAQVEAELAAMDPDEVQHRAL